MASQGWNLKSPETGQHNNRRIISILLTIIFLGITIIQIINIITARPNVYIIDIYGYYPAYFWILILALIIICGVLLSYFSIFEIHCRYIILVVFALLIIACTLYLQSKFLFFFTTGGDSLSHVAYLKDILASGGISNSPYPATHILIASIVMLLDISPLKVIDYMPVMSFLVYFLSLWTIGRTFFKNNPFIYYFLGLSSLPLFGFSQTEFWPNMFMILFTPIIIYILLKCNSRHHKEFFVLMIIVTLFISYTHNLYALIWLILLFVVFFVSLYKIRRGDLRIIIPIVAISLCILSIIFYYQALLILFANITYTIDILFLGGGVVEGQEGVLLENLASQLTFKWTSIFTAIRLAFFYYGSFAFPAIISGITFIYLIIFSKYFNQKFNYIIVLISACSISLYVIAVVNFIFSKFGAIRIYTIANIFTIILIPLFLRILIKNSPDRRNMILTCMVIVFSLLAIISVFTVHYSPYFSLVKTNQLTESEYDAMTTFYNNWENSPVIDDYGEYSRFYQSIYGKVKADEDNLGGISGILGEKDLSYKQFNTLAQRFGRDQYFIHQTFPMMLSSGSIPSPFDNHDSDYYYLDTKFPRPSENSKYLDLLRFYNRVENDNSVLKIYSNEQTYIYYIQ